ncbi:MAG: DNA polymerase III subunit beta [Chloroflexi bacterium]|nr:DNA polymerase III subunit beta [Chloroflexota bacterium]
MNVLLSDLKSAVNNAARNVSSRSTIPVLHNIFLMWTGDELKVAGTNLDRFYLTRVEGKDGEPFAITVPAKTMVDIVNSLAADTVSLEYDPKTVKLHIDGGATFDINGIDAQDYPPLPNPLVDAIQVDGAVLVEAVRQVSFAASTDEARPVMLGVHWKDGYMAATDGFRIARVKAPEGIEALVPASSWVEAVKHYAGAVHIQARNGQLAMDDGDTLFASQLIEGNFPDYKAIIPKSFKHVVRFTRSELLAAIKRLTVIARDGSNIVSITFDGLDVVFSTSAEGTGHAEETVPHKTDDEQAWTINFNINFLRQAVEASQGEVYLRLNEAVTPAQIDYGKPDEWLTVIMPMHKG